MSIRILNTEGKYPHEQVGAELELAKPALLVFSVFAELEIVGIVQLQKIEVIFQVGSYYTQVRLLGQDSLEI